MHVYGHQLQEVDQPEVFPLKHPLNLNRLRAITGLTLKQMCFEEIKMEQKNRKRYQLMMIGGRKLRGWSQLDLALEIGFSDRTVWETENRERVPYFDEAQVIAKVLFLDFDDFWQACRDEIKVFE